MTYWPATIDILTPGHIRCLEWLKMRGEPVVVGLLTDSALQGYKRNVVSFKDRRFILNTIARAIGDIFVVPQNSLDPTENVIKYHCDSIASGDGWEKVEKEAIKKLQLTPIIIRLKGEKRKKYSSSAIKKRILSC